ncbi:hypothetical protein SAMN05421538_10449 [Paracoccus isoporae]|uniref:Uncharacterized protein n=1 Tax=Paracoccus isoporae TaxID=591205 RepID=A0A1G7A6X2_9RHOB|nr:hypothetical protein [Paracoccus isoporae]SDE10562.1 hypothetical protein SAMN05421538_10449 [Paracoccus isoporae]
MQMLINYTISDYAKFKSAFDADNEDRRNNGLSLLQLWREDGSSAWALFDLHDAKKARDYLDGAAGAFNSQAGVSAVSAHTLETA